MVFVTGGTGMLGAYLLYYLTLQEEQVVAIKRESSSMKVLENVFEALSKNPAEQLAKINWKIADITDYLSIVDAMAGCQWVYHTAAIVSFDARDKERMLHNNINGTANVVTAALHTKIKKFCHVSSIASLGESVDNEELNEESKRTSSQLHSNYSRSKYLSEMEVWRAINEGLEAVIVNPSVILGIGDWKNGSSSMFGQVNKGFKFYTKGGTGFVDASDVAQSMIKLMKSEVSNQRFVINSENLAYRKVFDLIAENLQKPKAQYYASPFLSGIAWRAAGLFSFLLGTKPVLTKETILAANNTKSYSNNKIKRTIEHNFLKIEDSIKEISQFFVKNKHI